MRLSPSLSLGLGLGLLLSLASPAARAGDASSDGEPSGDAVDAAYARGSRAASEGDWPEAVRAFEAARRILPVRSAQLSYDLGTAYANMGELGYASYHLARALRDPVGLDAQLAESARRNAAIVRRRLELHAAGASLQLSEPEDWRDALARLLASTVMGWIALGMGALGLVLGARAWWRARKGAGGRSGTLALAAAAAFLVIGAAHRVAVAGDRAQPGAIVLPERVDVREGPGAHTVREFEISAGSRVWVRERRSGWAKVQTPSGLLGWVEQDAIGALDAGVGEVPPAPADEDATPPAAADDVGQSPT